MIRQMIKIDEEKCNGCGLCITACHENALKIENGKAKLIRDDYCDGLGNCLPVCPMDAISFEQREALPYDEEAVIANNKKLEEEKSQKASGCLGAMAKTLQPMQEIQEQNSHACSCGSSMLKQWPVQIKLVPAQATFFQNCDLLIAADCCAYSYGNFHKDFMSNKITLIACPKLDNTDYAEKLADIFKYNAINSVTVARMIVPCCTGIELMAKKAIEMSGKEIPLKVSIITTEGKLL